jgi:hypothetical protein
VCASQDRAVEISCTLIAEVLATVNELLAPVGLELAKDAYLFSNDPQHATWNLTGRCIRSAIWPAGPESTSTSGSCGTTPPASSSLLGSTCRKPQPGSVTARRGATTLKQYADPVSEVDRRAAAYLAELTKGKSA